MQRNLRKWIAFTATVGFGLAWATVGAQDYPTHKGSSQRVGHNGDAFGTSPGLGNLRWWHPDSTEFNFTSFIRDNTSSLCTRVGAWGSPTTLQEAQFVYVPKRTGDVAYDSLMSSFFDPASPNYNNLPITPGYNYAAAVASLWTGSALTYNPTVPASGTARTATWNVTPTTGVAGMYAVYVWLPAGPTDIATSRFLYPQRYFVYKVTYGSGQTFIDVVDTSLAGTGWVRLGAGGAVTDRAFAYDGVNPITVTLYNTIPRDSTGNLLVPSVTTTYLVYADAAMSAPVYGTYAASPVVARLTGGADTVTVAALNRLEVGKIGSSTTMLKKGVVTSYTASTGAKRWSFSPLDESSLATNLDSPSALVTAGPGWTNSTVANGYQGNGYFTQGITSNYASATAVVYSPNLADGDYDIYVWVAGSSNGAQFAGSQNFEIREGSTTTLVQVNMDTNKGWVKLGNRRYDHRSSSRLSVHALNYSTDPADSGRSAYADTVRFVGAANLAINSTPIHVNGALIKKDTNPLNPPEPTDVVIVAAEDGRLYCLDSNGNGDGTTTVYWTYPSTPDPNNSSWSDPNHDNGLDGPGGVAEMPSGSGFDLSSGLVERIDGSDRLFIAARNGRIYCIDVTGRGDFNAATRRPGTTTRIWSYPDDYPATPKKSNLGAFTGSLAFANTSDGPTVFVPAPQGRIYALDARPHANRTTVVRWQYPLATEPTLGEISMTPAIGLGNIYFGTKAKDEDATGEFYALNINTGAVVWKFSGTASVPADDFTSSPAFVPASEFRTPGFSQAATVFVANENRFVYALDAAGNGDGTTSIIWSTDELGTTASASLSFVAMQIYATGGGITATPQPILMVPTVNGRLVGLHADGQTNRFGTKRAWEYNTGDAFIASAANGRGWLYGASSGGFLLAFNAGSGYLSPGAPPGEQVIVENDRTADVFRECRVKLISEANYRELRTRSGTATYSWLDSRPEVTGNPLAFEWGQTIYAVVYRFPHDTTNTVGATVAEPSVNFVFSVEGATTRTVTVASVPFPVAGAGNPPVSSVDGTTLLDGYAAVSFPIQPGGGMSLAPGNGVLTFSISTSSLNDTGARQTIALDSTQARREFKIANPLALLMNGKSDLSQAIGYSTDPKDPENLANGNPRGTVNGKVLTRLTKTTGLVSHGNSESATISIVDRSLMAQLYGWDRGLPNVRIQRNDLLWRGGAGAVYKPLDTAIYPNYEDFPTRYPNDSLDYPDISRERLTFVSNPNLNPSNPIFSGVDLIPPTQAANLDPLARTLNPTDLEVRLDVPKFQPPNATAALNSAGSTIAAGYMGTQYVYVDNGTGQFNRSGGQRNAYRAFRFGGNVDADERLSVTTPVVDNGSLAHGHGFSPLAPWDPANTLLNPAQDQTSGYSGKKFFATFNVVNEGNVNLRNLRLAKFQQFGANSPLAWPIYSLGNHETAWLETGRYVFSNLDDDPRWNVTSNGRIALQKARVGDRVGTELSLNPIRRANPNLNVNAAPYSASLPVPYLPSVAVTVPLGFPVGTYAQTMRIINEDDPAYPANNALSMDSNAAGLETYSDPTFVLRFNVRESRLTNSFTAGTVPMVDSWTPTNERFLHRNVQPTAMRTPLGGLIAAWASNRSNWDEPLPGADAKFDDQWRIYIASLAGTSPNSVGGTVNPLRELGYFVPAASNRWFDKLNPSGGSSGAFPKCDTVAEANSLFNVGSDGSILINTVKFGSPSLPTNGLYNPLTGALNPNAYMAFLGEAQLQTANGRAVLNRLFLAPVTLGSGGNPVVGSPILAQFDDGKIQKSKPSVIQVNENVTVLFGGGSAGKSQLMCMSYSPSGGWSPIRSFSTGGGFEYATSPSVSMRRFASTAGGSQLPFGQAMLEISFVGKLRGRPNSEVFFGRVLTNDSGVPLGGNNPAFAFLPNKDREQLVSGGEPGVFRTDGVAWNLRNTIRLEQTLDGTTYTDLEVPGTRSYDRATGRITFTTKLGGKAYLDPGAGIVRLANAVPATNAILVLSYQPRFIRISGIGTNAGHSSPSILFDNRLVAETSYWVGLSPTDGPSRYLHVYGKSSPGGGQTTRPYLKTMRLGVQLPFAIATQPNGFVTSLTVSGHSGAYQVDPVNGRIFFTAVDEAKPVTINALLKAPNGNLLNYSQTSYVSFTTEREEAPVTIEQAVNESGMHAFLDPFNLGGGYPERRPGLIWLFWTSTRAGAPDIYFETIAPRFTPVPPGQ